MPEAWPSVAAAFTKEATAMTKPATGGRLPQGISAAAMPTAASWRCSGGGTAMNAAELLSMPMPAPSMGCHRPLILLENANLQIRHASHQHAQALRKALDANPL